MVKFSPSAVNPKRTKAKTPKKSGAVDSPAKTEMKMTKLEKNTPEKAALPTPKGKKESLGKKEKGISKISAKPEMKIPKQEKNTPAKAALQTAKEKKKALVKKEKSTPNISAPQTPKNSKLEKPASINEAKINLTAAPQAPHNVTASGKKNKKTKTSKHEKPVQDLEMESVIEGKTKVTPEEESVKSAGSKKKSKTAAGKRKLDDIDQSGGDQKRQKRQKITYDHELFIARLSFDTSKDTVKEHFSQFGEVVNVNLPLKSNTQSNKGFAFVAFKEASSIESALSDTNQEIDSAKIVIEAKKSKKALLKEVILKPSHPNELFVGGLNKSTERSTLKEYFSKYGTVGNVTLPWKMNANTNKTFGFVSFESAASRQSALEDDHEIDGKKVDVSASEKKPKESGVVSKKVKTKQVKAAPAAATVEDEDEEMESLEAEDEEDETDDEVEGEDDDEEVEDDE